MDALKAIEDKLEAKADELTDKILLAVHIRFERDVQVRSLSESLRIDKDPQRQARYTAALDALTKGD